MKRSPHRCSAVCGRSLWLEIDAHVRRSLPASQQSTNQSLLHHLSFAQCTQ